MNRDVQCKHPAHLSPDFPCRTYSNLPCLHDAWCSRGRPSKSYALPHSSLAVLGLRRFHPQQQCTRLSVSASDSQQKQVQLSGPSVHKIPILRVLIQYVTTKYVLKSSSSPSVEVISLELGPIRKLQACLLW